MIRALALAAAVATLAACGQKGPLRLPEAKPPPASAAPITPVAPTPPPGNPSSP